MERPVGALIPGKQADIESRTIDPGYLQHNAVLKIDKLDARGIQCSSLAWFGIHIASQSERKGESSRSNRLVKRLHLLEVFLFENLRPRILYLVRAHLSEDGCHRKHQNPAHK